MSSTAAPATGRPPLSIPDPRPGDLIRRHALPTAAVLATSAVLALVALWFYRRDPYWDARWTVDLTVYLASGQTVRDGQSLYDLVVMSPLYGPMPYIYPPLTAMLFFVPLSFLPAAAAGLVWNTASLAALGAAIWIAVGRAGVRERGSRTWLTVLALVLAAWLLPVRLLLVAGQINAFLLLLLMLDFRRPHHRWQGVAIGIAAGLKITPLIFIGYLVVTRRWAAAVWAGLAFLTTVAVGFVLAPADSREYWGGLVVTSSRAGDVFDTPNQSLSGLLGRVTHTAQFSDWWFVLLGLVACHGLAVGAMAYRRGADLLGMSAVAVTGLLISPVSWEHHWVYVIPLLVWLAVGAYRWRSVPAAVVTAVLVALFTVRTFSLVGIAEAPPAPMDLALWEQVVANQLPLTGLALLLVGPLWVRRFPVRSAADDPLGGTDTGLTNGPRRRAVPDPARR